MTKTEKVVFVVSEVIIVGLTTTAIIYRLTDPDFQKRPPVH